MTEFKACPFCGARGEVAVYVQGKIECVECTTCNICLDINAWNTRPTEDRLRGIIGELVGKIYALDNWDARSVLDGQALYRELGEAVDRARQEFTDGEGE
jgi:hypothetical protein